MFFVIIIAVVYIAIVIIYDYIVDRQCIYNYILVHSSDPEIDRIWYIVQSDFQDIEKSSEDGQFSRLCQN